MIRALLFVLFLAFPLNAAATSPNFIVFFTDDLGWGDLGSYGHPTIRTPHLDRLAREGQRWTSFYVTESVCSPSRGALLTGRLGVRTGLYGFKLPVFFEDEPDGFPARELTVAEALKDVGYATALIGKWHLGDAPKAYPTRHGFDYWWGIPYSNDMRFVKGPSRDDIIRAMTEEGHEDKMNDFYHTLIDAYKNPDPAYWDIPVFKSQPTTNGFKDTLIEQPLKQDRLTMRITQQAISFIKKNREKPFFLYVPYAKPHTPLFPGKKFRGKSVSGLYGDAIEELDWSVGQIVATLEKLGLHKKTLVFFTSDNGPLSESRFGGGSAGPFRGGKRTTWEGGHRVPAIFWWPGRIQPLVRSDMGSTLDLFPTFLSLAKRSLPKIKLDGYDLSDTLLKNKPSPRTTMPYYLAGRLWAYRKGLYKIKLIKKGEAKTAVKSELIDLSTPILYHLGKDPGERFDIAEEHPEKTKELLAEVKRFQDSLPTVRPLFDQRLSN